MSDQRIQKFADLLVNYSLGVKPGDKFLISGSDLTLPLMKEVYRAALKAGAHPETDVNLPGLGELMIKEGNEDQLMYVSPLKKQAFSTYDVFLSLWGGHTTKPLAGLDDKKIAMSRKAGHEIFKLFLDRLAKGEAKWCGTQFPTYASAQDADMTLEDYEDFVFKAGLLHLDDPVAEWKKISAKQDKICAFLDEKKEMRFVGPGTDLTLTVEGRKWINCDGKENFPDGEVFTTPIKDSVNGHISFTFPAIYSGKEVEGVQLTFEKGKVVKATAEKGEDFLMSVLDTDEGARFVGEIAIGTNYGITDFTKNILFDEKIGGTVHLAVGAALPETGGQNDSAVHWDMICDMRNGGQIFADGELIYENGHFVRKF